MYKRAEFTPEVVMEMLDGRESTLAPSKPNIADWAEHHVDLEWEDLTDIPENPTTGYSVEKLDKHGGDWEKCAFLSYHDILMGDGELGSCEETIDGKKIIKMKINNLIECNSYQFRVVAEKAEGQTKPGPASKSVCCKSRFVSPRIYRQTLQNVLIPIGQVMVRLAVRVTGEPKPSVIWKNDHCNDLSKSSNCIIETGHMTASSFNSFCTIKVADRESSGTYTAVASNQSGKSELQFNVNFTEKPGRPQGPLCVYELHNTGCTLDWIMPTDTGGLPIDRYEVEIQYEGTDLWLQHARTAATNIAIDHLIKGTKYHFRVIAHNKMGYSLPLQTTDLTLIKNPVETPAKPQNVTISEWDKDFATIKWDPPLKDGGYPIEGYLIEKRHISGSEDWTLTPADPLKCEGTVTDLTPQEKYEFCVYASNEMGRGTGECSRMMIARCMKLVPEVKQSALGRVYIGSGEPFYANVDVNGEPPPKLQWNFNGQKLREDPEHVQFSYKEYNSKIKLTNLAREHSGAYTLVATNEHGKAEGTLYLTITDRPFPPEGPLDVDDINAHSCKLTWQMPADNGGARVDGYIIDKMDELSGVWIGVDELKDGETLEYDVKDLEEDHRYHFRVRAINKNGKSLPLQTREKILMRSKFGAPCQPLSVEVTDFDFDHVVLGWKPPSFDGGSELTSYTVQKKFKQCTENLGKKIEFKDWETVEELDADKHELKIKKLVMDCIYEFRVIATNKKYGNGDPSEPSDPFKIKNKNVEPRIEHKGMRDMCIEHGDVITYSVDVFGEPPPKKTWILNGQNLNTCGWLRVRIADEDYHTKITIRDTKRSDSGTLSLNIENRNGEDDHTVNIMVLGPPDAPFKVRTKDVTKGGVTVYWKAPKDDGGSAVKKYWIEKLDLADNIWMKAQPDPVTSIYARIQHLFDGHSYHFRIKAVNAQGESEPSEESEMVTIREPMGRQEWMKNCMKMIHTSAETKEPEKKEEKKEDGPQMTDMETYEEEGRTIA